MSQQPTRSQVHVNRPLTNISVAFIQKAEAFVARQVFKSIPVQKQADAYFTYPRDQWFTDEMQQRAPGAESAGSGYKVDTDTYAALVWSLHKDVADQIRNNADDPINLDREAAEFLTSKYLIRQERLFAQKYFAASIWTGSSTGGDITPGTKWDASTGNPIKDVNAQMTAMQLKTSYRPNTLVVTRVTHDALKENADIKDRIRYVEKVLARSFTNADMAALFGIERYLILEAVYNSAKEGATRTMAWVAGTDAAALYYAAPNPGLQTPSAGYTFDWVGHVGAGAQGQAISNFRMEHLKSDRFEIEAAFDMKVVASDLGVYFTDVLTT